MWNVVSGIVDVERWVGGIPPSHLIRLDFYYKRIVFRHSLIILNSKSVGRIGFKFQIK